MQAGGEGTQPKGDKVSRKARYTLVVQWSPCKGEYRTHLRQRSALANGDDVANFHTESWRAVGGDVLVPLLVPVVFWNVVEAVGGSEESGDRLNGMGSVSPRAAHARLVVVGKETPRWDHALFSADDDGSGHLRLGDDAGQDSASDGDLAGEWALLVNVGAVDGFRWGL